MLDHETLELEIGSRGQAQITSANRNLVRRWLCSQGVDSPTARGLTLAQLSTCYNDTSDSMLKKYRDKGGPSDELDRLPAPKRSFEPVPKQPAAPVLSATDSNNPEVRQIAALLSQLISGQSKAAPIDESRIIELIRQHAPITAVEIRIPDREPKKLNGHHHKAFPDLLKMVSAGVNVWLSGPAGSGKTTLAHQCAQALERPFYSTGAVTSDFRLMGFVNAQGEIVRTPFREAFEHGGVFLWDEIDASNPNALTAFNQALANGHFTFPDKMVDKHPDFVAIAAANTWGHGPSAEYVGRTRIDAATLDRFVTLFIDYDENLETALAGSDHADWCKLVQTARAKAKTQGMRHIISPRAVVDGVKLLSAGLDRKTVLHAVLRKGLDSDSWRTLRDAIGGC